MKKMIIRRIEAEKYEVAEAMDTLCTNLSLAGDGIKKIVVTSTRPMEGKSFVCMNMLRTVAGLGKKVVLLDADVRASRLQYDYKIKIVSDGDAYLGLNGYLSGQCGVDEIIYETNIQGADVILAGEKVSDSFQRLDTERLSNLLDHLSSQYDFVIIDTPPIGVVIDAVKIARYCDGVVFVVGSGSVTASSLESAVHQIYKSGCPVLGYVLNKAESMNRNKYGAYYGK